MPAYDANNLFAKILRGDPEHTLVLMTGSALTDEALKIAQQIAGKTGCKVMGQTYHPRMARGQGRFSIDRIPYVIESALPILKDFKHIVLVEANDPVAFFAYPNKPSMLKAEGTEVHRMTSGAERPTPHDAAVPRRSCVTLAPSHRLRPDPEFQDAPHTVTIGYTARLVTSHDWLHRTIGYTVGLVDSRRETSGL